MNLGQRPTYGSLLTCCNLSFRRRDIGFSSALSRPLISSAVSLLPPTFIRIGSTPAAFLESGSGCRAATSDFDLVFVRCSRTVWEVDQRDRRRVQ